MLIKSKGNPDAKIWIITEKPYPNDTAYLYDGSYGYHFHRIWEEAGLPSDSYLTSYKPDSNLVYDDEIALQDIASEVNKWKPPLIIMVGDNATGAFLPFTKSRSKPYKPRVETWAGSLLKCEWFNYDHYCICTHAPDHVIADWFYRDIQCSLDFGRVRSEYEYYTKHGHLQPLPQYDIRVHPTIDDLCNLFTEFAKAPFLSVDIETIRPRKQNKNKNKSTTSAFKHSPGFPYLLGIADSPTRAVSIPIWEYNEFEIVRLIREIDSLLSKCKVIGQNYFNFDSHFLDAFGFQVVLSNVHDTMIRSVMLWPELEHSLQFLTKQYTRQPYYKDEGKGFSPRNRKKLEQFMYYNALDCVVTYEVFNGQERDFNDRPQLK